MTNAPNADGASVIHIRAGSPGESEHMDAALASLPCHVTSITNVYSGLATLGRVARDHVQCTRVRAIIVEVDTLTSSEMPFFTFAPRLLPNTPILVYGEKTGAPRVTEARKLGATGWASSKRISDLFEMPRPAGASADAPDVEGESTENATSPLDQRIDPLPSTPIAQPQTDIPSAEAAREPEAHVEVDQGEIESADAEPEVPPARVPWLSYEDVPTRRGPARVKPSASPMPVDNHETPPKPHENPSLDSGPLLTDEELQALIGDDISAVAPREPSRRPPAGGSDQGGDA